MLLVTLAVAAAVGQAAEEQVFALYKWQQRIGIETSYVARGAAGTEIRTAFAFTDRTTTVPLAATLRLRPDGSPIQFGLWGATSRGSSADDLVTAIGKTLTIKQRGVTRTLDAPDRFFVGSTYAPVILIQELLGYWAKHSRPARLPVFPVGEVGIEKRGTDLVADDEGKPRTLARYAISGLEWGRVTAWLDESGKLAALKAVDTEFDHFEATGHGFSGTLPLLVARSGADGMAAMLEASRSMRPHATGKIAYVNARLIDATGADAVPDAVVLVEGSRIAAVGPRTAIAVPLDAQTIDLGGKTLLPGLWDMHAHFEQVEWGPLYLAAGVTTARDCGNEMEFIRAVRDAIDAGDGLGPRLLLACFVDGDGPGALGKSRLRSADQIPELLAGFKAAGCSQVKIYQSLDPNLIAPLATAAHQAGMTVTGHVPTGIGAVHAVEAGLDQINHLSFVLRAFIAPGTDPNKSLEYPVVRSAVEAFDAATPAARELAAWFATKRVVVDPTLALEELFSRRSDELAKDEPGLAKLAPPLRPVFASMGPPLEDAAKERAFLAKSLAFLGLLHTAGVPIVAGTDQAVPGHSIHREIELYVQAGFTPMEAIQAATLVPARAMRLEGEVGTLEPGKRADMIVVDGDPLADVRNLRRITLVVAAGRAYEPSKLWQSVEFEP